MEAFGGLIGEYLSEEGYIAYNGSAEGWRCLPESICIGLSGYSHKPFIAKLITLMIHAGKTLRKKANAAEFKWSGNGSRHAEGPDANDHDWDGLTDIFGIDPDALHQAIKDLTKIQTMDRMLEAPVFALASIVLRNSAFEAILPTPDGTRLKIDGYLAGCNSSLARTQRLAIAGDNIIRSTVLGQHYYGFRKATQPIMPIAELMASLLSEEEVTKFIVDILDGPQGSACRRAGPNWKALAPQPAAAGGGGGPGSAAAAAGKPASASGGGGPSKSAVVKLAAAAKSTAADKTASAGKAAAASGGGGAHASAAAPPQPPTDQSPAGPGSGAGASSSSNDDSARSYEGVVAEKTH